MIEYFMVTGIYWEKHCLFARRKNRVAGERELLAVRVFAVLSVFGFKRMTIICMAVRRKINVLT
jgi:hypothetical protein